MNGGDNERLLLSTSTHPFLSEISSCRVVSVDPFEKDSREKPWKHKKY